MTCVYWGWLSWGGGGDGFKGGGLTPCHSSGEQADLLVSARQENCQRQYNTGCVTVRLWADDGSAT